MDAYDTVIIGGGAAGCILAARLTENGARRVALIEAGDDTPPDALPEDIRDPYPISYSNPAYFWPSLTARGHVGAPEAPYPQARVMGGGSSVMGMWALRGVPEDYDEWSALGASGWAWDDVLPAFKRLERDLDYGGDLHGANGPIPIRRHRREKWPGFARALLKAAGRQGLPFREDINAEFADGVFPVPVTNDAGGRVSSATGYLTAQVRGRSNLAIIARAEATHILLDERIVTGVTIRRERTITNISCKEVVLAAGAIGSPALLLRSGIGPGAELQALGIEPHVDLRSVGRGLQNHCVLNLAMRIAPQARQAASLRTYGLACARVSSKHPEGRRGDLHLQFIAKTSAYPHGDRLGIVGAALYAPLSRGTVRLKSPQADVSPQVEFRLLDHPADHVRLAVAVRLVLGLLEDPAVRHIRGEVFNVVPSSVVRRLNRPSLLNRLASTAVAILLDCPNPVRRRVLQRAGRVLAPEGPLTGASTDDLLDCVTPVFHPVGTCAMGRAGDPSAVVDPVCRVQGVRGLRVADASIMPRIPTANTCLPTMMIAEHAAERVGPSLLGS